MKLITLNVWCGKLYEPLKEFIEKYSKDVDIFCFQEVRNGKYLNQSEEIDERIELFNEMELLLPDFIGYFSETDTGIGLATFVRNELNVDDIKSTTILTKEEIQHIKMLNGQNYHPRLVQSIYIQKPKLIIHNFHGIPGSAKSDTKEREMQTDRLLEVINKNKNPQIVVGDFNLDLKTEAISRIEKYMRNLVKENNIQSTRNFRYKFYETLPFADYIFISNDVEIKKFEVLQDEVSDHLALLLDFN